MLELQQIGVHSFPKVLQGSKEKLLSFLEVSEQEMHTRRYQFLDYLVSNVVVQHSDDRGAFAVRDGVKDFVHFGRMAHVDLGRGQKRRSGLSPRPCDRAAPSGQSAAPPRWDGCCPARPGPERACSRLTQTASRCRTPGSSSPRTGTLSMTQSPH